MDMECPDCHQVVPVVDDPDKPGQMIYVTHLRRGRSTMYSYVHLGIRLPEVVLRRCNASRTSVVVVGGR